MNRRRRVLAAVALVAVAALLREPLEARLLTHVLVQMPLLVAAGVILAPCFDVLDGEWNRGGTAALVVVAGCLAVWMLPRSVDAALRDPVAELAKFASLPVLGGVPLALGVRRAPPLLRAFLAAQAVAMCGVLAFLYTHAPVRLCNGYTEEAQRELGIGFLALGLALAFAFVLPLFDAPDRPAAPSGPTGIDAGGAAGKSADDTCPVSTVCGIVGSASPPSVCAKSTGGSGRRGTLGCWSGRADSNRRPAAPKAAALPDCATPRHRRR